LTISRRLGRIAIHPTCSTTPLGLAAALKEIAGHLLVLSPDADRRGDGRERALGLARASESYGSGSAAARSTERIARPYDHPWSIRTGYWPFRTFTIKREQ
jgi:hypothetical protein